MQGNTHAPQCLSSGLRPVFGRACGCPAVFLHPGCHPGLSRGAGRQLCGQLHRKIGRRLHRGDARSDRRGCCSLSECRDRLVAAADGGRLCPGGEEGGAARRRVCAVDFAGRLTDDRRSRTHAGRLDGLEREALLLCRHRTPRQARPHRRSPATACCTRPPNRHCCWRKWRHGARLRASLRHIQSRRAAVTVPVPGLASGPAQDPWPARPVHPCEQPQASVSASWSWGAAGASVPAR